MWLAKLNKIIIFNSLKFFIFLYALRGNKSGNFKNVIFLYQNNVTSLFNCTAFMCGDEGMFLFVKYEIKEKPKTPLCNSCEQSDLNSDSQFPLKLPKL